MKPVVVHGGGPMISEWQGRMGLEPKFVDGRRYTDEMTLDLARMVLIGKANSDLVAHLVSLGGEGCWALGHRRRADQGEAYATRSSGFVGEVTQVDLGPVKALMDAGYLVVVAPSADGSTTASPSTSTPTRSPATWRGRSAPRSW